METYFVEIEEARCQLARERTLADLKVLARDTEYLFKAMAHFTSEKAGRLIPELLSHSNVRVPRLKKYRRKPSSDSLPRTKEPTQSSATIRINPLV